MKHSSFINFVTGPNFVLGPNFVIGPKFVIGSKFVSGPNYVKGPNFVTGPKFVYSFDVVLYLRVPCSKSTVGIKIRKIMTLLPESLTLNTVISV